jgi:bifunctional DNase/RNase
LSGIFSIDRGGAAMIVEVEIESFGVDPASGSPVVVLREKGGGRKLAVGIGPVEAGAIVMKSFDIETDIPLAVDLVRLVAAQLGAALDKVVFYEAGDNAFHTKLYVVRGTSAFVVECRPADALALGARTGVPLFVEEAVLEKLGPAAQSEREKLKQRIRNLDTLEFGRYRLE